VSLLLDALKRAEDAKRAKAEAATGSSPPSADGSNPPAAGSAPTHAAPVAASATPPLALDSTVAPAEIASESTVPQASSQLLALEVVESRGVDPVSLSARNPTAVPMPSAADESTNGGAPPMTMEALLASELGIPVPKQARQAPAQTSAATAAFRAARTSSVPTEPISPAPAMPALELYAIESGPRAGAAGPDVIPTLPANPALDSSNREAIKNAFAVKQSAKPRLGSKAKWALPLIGVLFSGLGAGGWYMWNEMNRISRPGVARSLVPSPANVVVSSPAATPAAAALPQAPPQAAPAQAGAVNEPALTTAGAPPPAASPVPEVDAPLPPLLPPPATQVREARAPMIAKIEPMTPREAVARRIEALPPTGADATTRVKLALAKPTSAPQISPALSAGYAALASGDYALAKRRYAEAISANANSADAHLGFATAAARGGESADFALAIRHYQRVLEIDPRNSTATAALIVLGGGPGAASSGAPRSVAEQETALRILISQDPNAANAHFLLGNLFAESRRWREAQQAYFEAARLQPQNADYSYNLAVSLDHLGQGAAAADFYKRALAATSKGQFDTAAVDRRITALSNKPSATNNGDTGNR